MMTSEFLLVRGEPTMSARIFTAETAVTSDRAGQNGAPSATKGACFDATALLIDWNDMGASDHYILVYEEDAYLLDVVSRFTGAGLAAGGAVVVVATQPHLDYLAARLKAPGLDLVTARAQGQYIPVDAAEMLGQFMVDGWPDAARFVDVVGGLMAQTG